jgi:hypothetical protein
MISVPVFIHSETSMNVLADWRIDTDNEIGGSFGRELEMLSKQALRNVGPYRNPQFYLVNAGRGVPSVLISCVLKQTEEDISVLPYDHHMEIAFGDRLAYFMGVVANYKTPFYTHDRLPDFSNAT